MWCCLLCWRYQHHSRQFRQSYRQYYSHWRWLVFLDVLSTKCFLELDGQRIDLENTLLDVMTSLANARKWSSSSKTWQPSCCSRASLSHFATASSSRVLLKSMRLLYNSKKFLLFINNNVSMHKTNGVTKAITGNTDSSCSSSGADGGSCNDEGSCSGRVIWTELRWGQWEYDSHQRHQCNNCCDHWLHVLSAFTHNHYT